MRSYPDANTFRMTYTGQRVLTISVRAEHMGQEQAFDLLESVRTRLGDDVSGEALNAVSMSFNGTGDIRTFDVAAYNRKISVAQLDVLLNQTVTRVVDTAHSGATPDYIGEVEMTGEDDLAGAGTFSVVAPPDE